MHPLLARLDRWLAANRPDYHDALMPGAAPAAVDGIARRVGSELPPLLRELLRWHDGQREDFAGHLESRWSLMSADGIAGALDDIAQIEQTDDFGDQWWGPDLVPFLANIFGDHLCVDLRGAFGGEPGQIIRFHSADEDRIITHPSLEAWLETLVIGLETGLLEATEDNGISGCDPADAAVYAEFAAGRNPGYPIDVRADAVAGDIRGESFAAFVAEHYEADVAHAVDLDRLRSDLRGSGVGNDVVDSAFERLREIRASGRITREK